MRITHLRLKNINSLVGEWTIDFTHPDYDSNGIFAIIGPTGAGKSTLLDAICLALYGETPRVDRISKNSNEVMARQTGECLAEVTFETSQGKFRSLWSQHRSFKKAHGDLQTACREIVNAIDNTILESQLNKVQSKIEEITGMDFKRFTRSMLLAQGGFDAFLKAPSGERAPILEQITGTKIYSHISKKIFERDKSEERKLKELQTAFTALQLLCPIEENKYLLEKEEKTSLCIAIELQLKQLEEQRQWRQEVDNSLLSHERLMIRYSDCVNKERTLQPSFRKLESALQALNHESEYNSIYNLKEQHKSDQEQLSKEIEKNVILTAAREESYRDLARSETEFAEKDNELKRQKEIFKPVRQLDADIASKHNEAEELAAAIDKDEKVIADKEASLQTTRCKYQKLEAQQQSIQEYFTHNANDGALIEKFAFIKEKLERLSSQQKQLEKKETDLANEKALMEKAKRQLALCRKGHVEVREEYEAAKKYLDNLLQAYEMTARNKSLQQWDTECRQLDERKKLYSDLVEGLRTEQQDRAQCGELREQVRSLKEREAICLNVRTSELVNKEHIELKLEELRRQQAHFSKVRSLAEERSKLHHGDPCPLCGALDHPYANDNEPSLQPIDQEILKARKELKGTEEKITTLTQESTGIEIEIGSCEKAFRDKSDAINRSKETTALLRNKLGVAIAASPDVAGADQELQRLCLQLEECKGAIDVLMKMTTEKDEAQRNFNKAQQKLSEKEGLLQKLRATYEKHENLSSHLKQDLTLHLEEYETFENGLSAELKPFSIYKMEMSDSKAIIESLELRLNAWRQQQRTLRNVEEELQRHREAIAELEGSLRHLADTLRVSQAKREQNTTTLKQWRERRRELFGDAVPDGEEAALQKLLDAARSRWDSYKELYQKRRHEVSYSQEKIKELRAKTEERTIIVDSREKTFTAAISQDGFTSLHAFQEARLSREEREKLTHDKQAFEMEKNELLAQKKAVEKKLEELNREPKTNEPLVTLLGLIQEARKNGEVAKVRTYQLEQILLQNEERKKKAQLLQEQIERQEGETELWNKLCCLVGAADGKKFRDIAQRMTLDMMIAHANHQLAKMSDRYLLIQSSQPPLELNIIDNYQTGQERSVKNLSGGESFIVSLALALGLARMSSSLVRVDTLFLDEGFGTLDDRALEMALDALSALQQEGKVVGLISHVAALKERIPTQIKISPISGGRSRIEGPGCKLEAPK